MDKIYIYHLLLCTLCRLAAHGALLRAQQRLVDLIMAARARYRCISGDYGRVATATIVTTLGVELSTARSWRTGGTGRGRGGQALRRDNSAGINGRLGCTHGRRARWRRRFGCGLRRSCSGAGRPLGADDLAIADASQGHCRARGPLGQNPALAAASHRAGRHLGANRRIIADHGCRRAVVSSGHEVDCRRSRLHGARTRRPLRTDPAVAVVSRAGRYVGAELLITASVATALSRHWRRGVDDRGHDRLQRLALS